MYIAFILRVYAKLQYQLIDHPPQFFNDYRLRLNCLVEKDLIWYI